MSKKRVLNVTSTKKRNGMLSYSNTTSAGLTRALAPGIAVVNGRDGGTFLWLATAQDLSASGSTNTVAQSAARTATTCFMRGLKEGLTVQTSTSIPWTHRRICFTFRGLNPFINVTSPDAPVVTYSPYLETSNGMQRLWLNQNINGMTATRNQIEGFIFKGSSGVDWNDVIVAPLDTTRIGVKFDKAWTYHSGNANGVYKKRDLWHPMNHNLVYDDDEVGAAEQASYVSVDSKAGMGDYYVLDYFAPGYGATVNDLLAVSNNSTLYWHEK